MEMTESYWEDHRDCPGHLVHCDDQQGWCDLHNQWWYLPEADEVLDL